jgi:hypothetical protein
MKERERIFNYEEIIAGAHKYARNVVKASGVTAHAFGCGWGWLQIPNAPRGVKGGLAAWMRYRTKESRDWGMGYGPDGGYSIMIRSYGQSADLARVHANAMADYVNDKLAKDPRTPQVFGWSKLD